MPAPPGGRYFKASRLLCRSIAGYLHLLTCYFFGRLGACRYGSIHLWPGWRGCTRLGSACASEPARCVASDSITLHAGFTYINALTEFSCIKPAVSLGDTGALLIRVLDLLRTRCKTNGDCRQNKSVSKLHWRGLRSLMVGPQFTNFYRLNSLPPSSITATRRLVVDAGTSCAICDAIASARCWASSSPAQSIAVGVGQSMSV
jgi:hypothetical protein